MQFSFHNPTQIQFGRGQIASIARLIPQDAKVLVLYGGGSIKSNGVYDQVCAALKAHQWEEFGGIEPNPAVETLDRAVARVKAEGFDFLLAVGGGSIIDGTKYVAAAARYDGYGWDILSGKHKVRDALPLGAILTLPATGSESNAAAVISRTATAEKRSFLSPAVYPVFAVLDPDTMSSLPDRQLANGLVDAFVHICEQYLTVPTGAMVQEGFAEALLRNLVVLAGQFDQRHTLEWRENLMWTANQALNGLIGAGVPHDWATHAIGHEFTALYGLDHAQTLALVQPALLRVCFERKAPKLTQMGHNVFGLEGDNVAHRTIDIMEQLYRSVGVGTRLSDYQLDKNDVLHQVITALEGHGMTTLGHQRDVDLHTVDAILRQAE
ncbi:iron-containing alcohol dehydrogenase [Ferrimonas balearica]|uniref:iron-containing alcohol dehydrogenase n=1 Tax=Ferrimonas balearica TaxID=44012 RepID=UPI001C99DE3F|nr:iron-containing alcohol dehydrogenase [Ferrimonas balearica]MBY5920814.1 iron-containing alcohol dehydrogenase [Ferrimonas balearica]MBY5996501.1 iron-containing alcohol dehydrogenase [Ferrimonas balearica]